MSHNAKKKMSKLKRSMEMEEQFSMKETKTSKGINFLIRRTLNNQLPIF